MPSRAVIDDFLAQRRLALVGASRDAAAFSSTVYRRLRDDGHDMVPVNAAADGAPIAGDASVRSLAELTEPVDGVIVMVPSTEAVAVVDEAIACGIPRVWLHRGSGVGAVSEEAVERCRAAGVAVVDGACPLMFSGDVAGVHRLHRWMVHRRLAA